MNSLSLIVALMTTAGVGDPQVRTDHPWYPGELACSTFPRLAATQAELYRRVTGGPADTDEAKALASWLWRNTHHWHGEEGARDVWGRGFRDGGDLKTRDYWTGLFAHGFALCGTTHAQWTAEMESLLGHGRARVVGVDGHNSFEVWLTGGKYGDGRWALLDHDLSTVIFNDRGDRLLSIREVAADRTRLIDRRYRPEKQHGWLVSGLDPRDGRVFGEPRSSEVLAGYAGPPPMVHLRRGESLRRYFRPGLEDGRTFAFWGINARRGDIPGPERAETWAGRPDSMRGSKDGPGHEMGRARFTNAVYRYEPDFAGDGYREGVVEEGSGGVTFEFVTPYLIAATPPNDRDWGIYDAECRNGLVLRGKASCPVALSTDGGATWRDCGRFVDGMDLTDVVKGRSRYLIRFGSKATRLAGSGLTMVTTCQANGWIMPRLKDGGTRVEFLASGLAVASAGPDFDHAKARIVAGGFGTSGVTIGLKTPRGEPAVGLFAAAHVASGNPPDASVRYQVEASTDAGATWLPVVKDWTIPGLGDRPGDSWSQSFCWGSVERLDRPSSSVLVRFRNDGGRKILRAEAHLTYRDARLDATEVTFDWLDDSGGHRASRRFPPSDRTASWDVPTGRDVQTRWVEFRPVGP